MRCTKIRYPLKSVFSLAPARYNYINIRFIISYKIVLVVNFFKIILHGIRKFDTDTRIKFSILDRTWIGKDNV